jgi:signal transduction histidine kinase
LARNGGIVWIQDGGFRIREGSNLPRPRYVEGGTHDIAERKVAEQELQKECTELEISLKERIRELNVASEQLEAERSRRERAEAAERELAASLLQSQAKERRRIARELHDTTAQKLAALVLNLGAAHKSAAALSSVARKFLAEALELAKEASHEVRTFSYLLHPPTLDQLALATALESYVKGFQKRSGIRVELEMMPSLNRLPREIQATLFGVVQEGLTNISRHSKSKSAKIRISHDSNAMTVEVKDKGRGVPSGIIRSVGVGAGVGLGVGLSGMQERLKQFGGQLQIDSSPRGTTLKATLPLSRSNSEWMVAQARTGKLTP